MTRDLIHKENQISIKTDFLNHLRESGHTFFADDYVKLKSMDFILHKDSIKDLPEKIK